MKITDWEEIKWIFKPDGSLLDIYIKEVDIEDWKNIIDFLNNNYSIKFGIHGQNIIINKINKEYVTKLLTSNNENLESRIASIEIDQISINTHFFWDKQIEFDIEPREIKNFLDYEKIVDFMYKISEVIDKEVILRGENQIEFPLIKVHAMKNKIEVLTKNEAEKLWK